MLSVSTGLLAKFASALAAGDDNKIEQIIQNKIEQAGTALIAELLISQTPIGPALSMARRTTAAIESGGASEFDRMGKQWLNTIRPSSTPVSRAFGKVEGFFRRSFAQASSRRLGRVPDWAQSRQQWLAEGWMHDWRSQPRNPAGGALHWSGAWIPGRLPYPVVTATNIGKGKSKASRRLRQLRKHRRAWRAAGRSAARSAAIMSSWSSD